MMETAFTPVASFGGGLLIGTAAVLLMLFQGRILGATGLMSGLIWPQNASEWRGRAALLIGMVAAPVVLLLVTGSMPQVRVTVSTTAIILGGLLVGLGVSYGGGCTSGHGVCGNARLSRRSIIATITFMVSATATVYVTRHLMGV